MPMAPALAGGDVRRAFETTERGDRIASQLLELLHHLHWIEGSKQRLVALQKRGGLQRAEPRARAERPIAQRVERRVLRQASRYSDADVVLGQSCEPARRRNHCRSPFHNEKAPPEGGAL